MDEAVAAGSPHVMAPALKYPDMRIGCDGGFFDEILATIRALARITATDSPDELGESLLVPWPPQNPKVRADIHVFTAPGSGYAVDLRYAVDFHDWIAEDVRRFQRFEGFLFVVDPRYERGTLRAVQRRLRVLRQGLEALGRKPYDVPFVVVVTHANAEASTRHPTASLATYIDWPGASYFDVDCVSGQGLDRALDHLLVSIRSARDLPAPSVKASCPDPLPTSETAFPAIDLAPILECLRQKEPERALRPLLEAWRRCRAQPAAELIDALSYTTRRLRPAQIRHRWWTATCRRRDLLDLPALVDSVFYWERDCELPDHIDQVVERLAGLRWWEDDPRLTLRLGSALADLTPYRKAAAQEAIGCALRAHGDPRAFLLIHRYCMDLPLIRPPHSYRVTAVADALTARTVGAPDTAHPETVPTSMTVPPEHQDAWNALVERIRRPLPRPEDMQSIADDPTSDDLRRELALRMQERGDPRGEFILLQLAKVAGNLSPEDHEREQALKRTYAWDWLGPLADVVDVENSVFEKGYPVKVTVWTPNTRAIRDVIGKPEWATIREMRWGGDPCWEEETPDPALVNHPVMKSLQSVTTKMPEDPVELEALKRVAWAR